MGTSEETELIRTVRCNETETHCVLKWNAALKVSLPEIASAIHAATAKVWAAHPNTAAVMVTPAEFSKVTWRGDLIFHPFFNVDQKLAHTSPEEFIKISRCNLENWFLNIMKEITLSAVQKRGYDQLISDFEGVVGVQPAPKPEAAS